MIIYIIHQKLEIITLIYSDTKKANKKKKEATEESELQDNEGSS